MRAGFDFDHIGAVFGEQAARFDADAADSEVQHAQAGERISPTAQSSRGRRGLRDGRERFAIVFANAGARPVKPRRRPSRMKKPSATRPFTPSATRASRKVLRAAK